MTHRIKINDEGHFCPFPGITIIANVTTQDNLLWDSVFTCMSNFNQYFSALPPRSYHMTTINLCTESQFRDERAWADFLSANLGFFEKISDDLNDGSLPFTASLKDIITDGVIQLAVAIPEELRNKIHEFAQKHALDKRLIPEHFHITLAYQYKRIPTKDTYLEITQRIKTALNEVFREHETFQLEPAKLNYFLDMTEFHTWDGHSDPFHSSSTYRL